MRAGTQPDQLLLSRGPSSKMLSLAHRLTSLLHMTYDAWFKVTATDGQTDHICLRFHEVIPPPGDSADWLLRGVIVDSRAHDWRSGDPYEITYDPAAREGRVTWWAEYRQADREELQALVISRITMPRRRHV